MLARRVRVVADTEPSQDTARTPARSTPAHAGRERERRAQRRAVRRTGNMGHERRGACSPLSNLVTVLSQRPAVERVSPAPVSRETRSAAVAGSRRRRRAPTPRRPPRARFRRSPPPGPEHERDLPFRRLAKAGDDRRRRAPDDLLELLRQLAADRHRRSGWASASDRRLAGSRRGDSNATAGHGQPRSSSHSAASAAPPRGR